MKRLSSDINGVIESISQHLEKGELRTARQRLVTLPWKKIPRDRYAAVGTLCRRLSLPFLSLKLLHPVINPSVRKVISATPQEKAEYSAALVGVGATSEAEALLNGVEGKTCPESLLYRAYSLFSQWRYHDSISILEQYVHNPLLTEYQRLVGQVNLAAALVNGAPDAKTEFLLSELRDVTRRRGFVRLCANAHELSAQYYILGRDWKRAKSALDEGERLFVGSETLDSFFLLKWRGVFRALTGRKKTAELKEIKAKARTLGHWETVRDCDLFVAISEEDRRLAVRLYFGSSFPAYRERLLKTIPFRIEIPETYEWNCGKKGKRVLDISGNTSLRGLTVGQRLHSLLCALASDFYRPFRIGTLFSILYPNEHFHPHHSPLKVHQLNRRLRRWLEHERIALKVRERNSNYSLASPSGIRIHVSKNSRGSTTDLYRAGQLRAAFGTREFSLSEAGKVLSVSDATVHRLLEDALQRGNLFRIGAGPRTRYKATS